ncbi:MAG: hypothetical protein HRT74_13650 [Flavobacteriales bacterium]|nr:hypothetical protein [Flavobacteriales bacterium]
MKNWFFLFGFLAVALISCQESLPEAPYSVRLKVECEDEEVRELVHNYYGKEVTYTIFNDSTFHVKRSAPTGEYQEWINEEGLRIQDRSPDNDIRAELKDIWLEEYLSDPILAKVERTEMTKDILGRKAIGYIGQNEAGDTTIIWVDEEIPNAWITLQAIPGLPLGYEYFVRGKKVTYTAESIAATEKTFDLTKWEENTVLLSQDYFLGVEESEELYLSGDGLLLDLGYFDMTTREVTDGIMEQTTLKNGEVEKARLYLNGGAGKVLLPRGSFYSLLFQRQGCVPKKITFDLTNQPEENGLFLMQFDVGTFPSTNMELNDYLLEVPIAEWTYDSVNDSLVYNEGHTALVNERIEEFRVGN